MEDVKVSPETLMLSGDSSETQKQEVMPFSFDVTSPYVLLVTFRPPQQQPFLSSSSRLSTCSNPTCAQPLGGAQEKETLAEDLLHSPSKLIRPKVHSLFYFRAVIYFGTHETHRF